jgi:hypothetical protein
MINIQDKVKEMADKNVAIIEEKCKKACEKFNCKPQDLIIEYYGHTQIKIKIKASEFEITNNFIFESKD